MQKSKASIFLWSVVAVMGFTMTGCLKSSEPQPQPAQAYVSILHLASLAPAPAVDIYLNNEKRSTNSFPAGGVSQTYSPINTGMFTFSFKKAGGDSLVTDLPASIYDSLGFYTIVLYNPSNNNPAMVSSMLIEDDFSDLTLDKPYFRFWQMSPSVNDIAPVDVYVDNTKVFSQRVLGDNEFSAYYNQFTASTAGYHNFAVKKAGSDSTIFSLNDVNLIAGNAYTLYLAGNKGGTGANQLTLGVLRAAN